MTKRSVAQEINEIMDSVVKNKKKKIMDEFDHERLKSLSKGILETYNGDGGEGDDQSQRVADMNDNTLQVCELLGLELMQKNEWETAT